MENALSLVALAISVLSGGFAFYTFCWTANRDRKQATLEAYNRLQMEVFDLLNAYTPEDIREICLNPKGEDYQTVSGYLARIEHFCVGINQRIYDRDTFYQLAHGYFDGPYLCAKMDILIATKNRHSKAEQEFYNDTISVLAWMKKKTDRVRRT